MKYDKYIKLLENSQIDSDELEEELDQYFDISNINDTYKEVVALGDEESISSGSDVKHRTVVTTSESVRGSGVSPLHLAIIYNRPHAVQWFLNNGADAALTCRVCVRKREHTQKLYNKKWVSSDYSGNKNTLNTYTTYSSIELANHLGMEDCINILEKNNRTLTM